jgi:hypothetical protein
MGVYDDESAPDRAKAKIFRGMDVGGSLFFSGDLKRLRPCDQITQAELDWSSSLI